ncbi:MAG: SurA N-terminal domain-containing protein [Rhodobacteraceae bacterium]|nr:SurA N-terminal domain-containing protein [Paracoccaceae bacterium]
MARAKGQAGKAVVWVLLGLLILGLAGFGATSFSGSMRAVGEVGDTEIRVDAYARAVEQDLRSIRAQTGQTLSFAQAQALGLDRAVLQRLVSIAAMDNETARIGLSAGDAEIRDRILDIPAFRGLDGSFDREAYAFALQNAGLSVPAFEADVRREVARTLLQGAVAGAVTMPEAGVAPVLTWLAERRSFSSAAITEAQLPEPLPAPTDAELRAFHQAEAARYTLPEARTITWAALLPENVMADVVIPEDRLREAYERRSAEFNRPERRLVERLVFPTTADADAARARLDAGTADFNALVEERGLSLLDVDMGDVTEAEIGRGGDAVFALAGPGVAGPVDSDLGPALFRVNAILAPVVTPFEDVAPMLLEEASADAARRLVADRREDLDNLLAGGATLQELAETEGLTLGTLDWRPGDTDGMAAYEAFRTAAAAVTADDFPELMELEDGGLFALQLDGTVPAALQPFEAVAATVRADFVADRLARSLREEAERLAGRLSEGATMSGLGLTVRPGAAVTRSERMPELPAGAVEAAFAMDLGEVRVVADEAGQVAILRLDAILPPDRAEAETAQLAEVIAQELSRSLAEDVLTAFVRALEAEAGIRLDQQAINAVNAQFN